MSKMDEITEVSAADPHLPLAAAAPPLPLSSTRFSAESFSQRNEVKFARFAEKRGLREGGCKVEGPG